MDVEEALEMVAGEEADCNDEEADEDPLTLTLRRLRQHHALRRKTAMLRESDAVKAEVAAKEAKAVAAAVADSTHGNLPPAVLEHELFERVCKSSFSDDPFTNHALRMASHKRTHEELLALVCWLQKRIRFSRFSPRQLMPLAHSMQVVTVCSGQRMSFRPGQLYIVLAGSMVMMRGKEWSGLNLQFVRQGDVLACEEWMQLFAEHCAEQNALSHVGNRLGSLLTTARRRMSATQRRASNTSVMSMADTVGSPEFPRGESATRRHSVQSRRGSTCSVASTTAIDSFLATMHAPRRSSVDAAVEDAAIVPILRRLSQSMQTGDGARHSSSRLVEVCDSTVAVVPGKSFLETALGDNGGNLHMLTSGATLVRMHIDAFQRTLTVKGSVHARSHAEFLRGLPCFKRWPMHTLSTLCPAIEIRDMAAGEVLWHQGSMATEVIVIRSGEVELRKDVTLSRTHRWPVPGGGWETLTCTQPRNLLVREETTGGIIGEETAVLLPFQTKASSKASTDVHSDLISEDLACLRQEEAVHRRRRRKERKLAAAQVATVATRAFANGVARRRSSAMCVSSGSDTDSSDGDWAKDEERASKPSPLIVLHRTQAVAKTSVQLLVLTLDFLKALGGQHGSLRYLQLRGIRGLEGNDETSTLEGQAQRQRQLSSLMATAVGPRYGQRHDVAQDYKHRSPSRLPPLPPTPTTELALLEAVSMPAVAPGPPPDAPRTKCVAPMAHRRHSVASTTSAASTVPSAQDVPALSASPRSSLASRNGTPSTRCGSKQTHTSAVTYVLADKGRPPPASRTRSLSPRLTRKTVPLLPPGTGVDLSPRRPRPSKALARPPPTLRPVTLNYFNTVQKRKIGHSRLRLAERRPVTGSTQATAPTPAPFTSATEPVLLLRTSARDGLKPKGRGRRRTVPRRPHRLAATPLGVTQSKVIEARREAPGKENSGIKAWSLRAASKV